MKPNKLFVSLALSTMCLTVSAQQLAFPGAQGFGRFATGGRMGSVYHVTNLNDSGTGSLRDAVSKPNRIVVFDVSGVIRINSRLVFSKNLYVAGQTAPGEGITVYGDGTSFSAADNIIVRYMRFRMGAVGTKDKDAGGIANGQNMIFDHCSFSWGQDENFSINWDNKGTAPQNITLMNSIVGQGLMTHSAGGLMQADNITLYRDLLVDNSTRNFKVKGTNQYVNNLVYNWKNYAYNMGGDSQGTSYVNIENNLFINGPAVGGDALTGGNSDFHFYENDNWQDKNRDGVLNPTLFTGTGGGDKVSTPYAYPELEKWAGNELIEMLLPEVGASLPYRDLADCYMVDEVLSFGKKGKLITNENELPIGVPTTWSWFKGSKPTDTDGDGMPDAWEEANGTDKAKNDAMTIADNGYANIENYINSITKDNRQFFLRAPLLLELASATTNSLTLSWADYSDNEDGFIVELQKDGAFVEVGRTTNSQFIIQNAGLEAGKPYIVRVCAYKGEERSAYTAELTVKTRPEQVDIIDVETFTGTGDGEWLINPVNDETVTLSEATPKTAVVVKSDANVTLNGAGYISGTASLNKAGKGTLAIASDQQYEGATVLHDGVYEFSSLKNGGVASGLGMSQEFAQNWVMDGGVYKYTGASTSTNRSAKLYSDTELNIAKSGAVVTMSGSLEGQGNLIIDGEGQISVATNNTKFFKFDGDVVLNGGTLVLEGENTSKAGLGTAGKLVMAGGQFITHSENDKNPKYTFPIEAKAGTTSKISFYRNCEMANKVSGSGTLEWEVFWVREYLEGNWDDFTGRVIVKGTASAGNSQFAPYNGTGIKNGTITLKGTAQIVSKKNQATLYLGGLSGDAGTYLSGFDVKNAGSGTWIVGTANTNETFKGIIDDRAQGGKIGKTSIVKQGTGEWRLTGKNIYSGTTQVQAGTLIVNGQHTGTGAITVSAGATLAGKGTLAAAVTVNGTLMVGDTLASDKGLTFSGGLKLGSAAILKLNEAMQDKTYYAGDEIKVFTGTATGTFAQILPATPGEGQTWDTSELYTSGVLKVVGGSEKPDDPTPDPEPVGETKKVCLAWGNMSRQPSDAACTKLEGAEASPSNNIGFSMNYTSAIDKTYSKGDKMTYEFDGISRTGIKLSNGAQNVIHVPEGFKVTKLTLWSVVGTNSSSRTSYWKEVAGKNYTEADAQILDLTATTSAPNKAEFVLNSVQDEVTFTNTGEQQSVIVVLEYHTGGTSGISSVLDGTPVSVEFFTLSGERVSRPDKGIYIMRATTASGKTSSRKVMY